MLYKQYAGSPDIFNEKGEYQKTVDWSANPQIEKVATPRPDIKTEADFASFAGKSITPSQFNPAEPLKTIGEPNDTTDYNSIVTGAMPPEPTKLELAQATEEAKVKQNSTDLMSLLAENQGKGSFEAEQMAKIGADQQEKEIQDITNQMRSLQMESQAQQLKAENQDKEMVIGAVRGQQAAIQRDTAVKTLMLSAQLQTKQNNYSLALNQVQRAVDLKYQPILDKIAILKEQYIMNKDMLERIDKRRADEVAQNIRKQEIDAQNKKEMEKETYNRKIKSEEISRDQFNADRQFEQAKLQADRQFEQNQKEFGADYALKVRAANLAEAKYKNDLVQQSIRNSMETDMEKTVVLQDKIKQIDSLISDPALKGAVGPNRLARDIFLGKLTGETQNFIGSVQQLISKDTLDELINLKAQGGTLGALSDQERLMLQSAASKIGTWAIRDSSGNVSGYNVSESAFKNELNRLKTLANRAVEKAGGISTKSDEEAYAEYLKMTNK